MLDAGLVLNKADNSPGPQGANSLVRIKDMELIASSVMDITKGEWRGWEDLLNQGRLLCRSFSKGVSRMSQAKRGEH